LASRLIKRNDLSNKLHVAFLLRRTISVSVTLNVLGMFVTLMGAQVIVGSLAAKVLTSTGRLVVSNAGPTLLQPLDILVVQANTNTLLSHFVSLVGALFLTRLVRRLDPPTRVPKTEQM